MPCSAVLSAELTRAACMREDLPVAGMVGVEKGAHGVVGASQSEQLPSLSYTLPVITRFIFLCGPLSWGFFLSSSALLGPVLTLGMEIFQPFSRSLPLSVSFAEWWMDFSKSDFPSLLLVSTFNSLILCSALACSDWMTLGPVILWY